MKSLVTSIIEISSDSMYLDISQKKKGKIEKLESIKYPLNFGKDTFSKGKVSFEKINKTCELINNFIKLSEDYATDSIKLYATTAVREAENKVYIADQIKVKTGLNLYTLDDSEEKFLIYKDIIKKLKNETVMQDKTCLIAYIGSGNIGVALYKNGNIVFNQNILIGTLKLSEILGELKYKTDKLHILIREYLSSFTNMLTKVLSKNEIENFIICGNGMRFLKANCNLKTKEYYSTISLKDFNIFFDTVKYKTPEKLAEIYKISEEKSEIILPSLGIYSALIELTNAYEMTIPNSSVLDALVYENLFRIDDNDFRKELEKSSILTAKNIAKRYLYDKKHADFVENTSLKLYDKLKKIHGLGDRERLLLQVAAILHDIGKYLNIKNHYKHSYNIILASDILGLTDKEIKIVANIARYHSRVLPSLENRGYESLKPKERLLCSKLVAILRVADALDRAHNQKIKDVELHMRKGRLQIITSSREEILMDEWTFIKKSKFFNEVFGMKIDLTKRRI